MAIPEEIRSSLPDRMKRIGISVSDLARLIEWSQPQLSGFLSGKRSGMGIDQMNRLHFMMIELEKLSLMLQPIPVDFGNGNAIRELIQRYKNGEISFYSSDEDANSAGPNHRDCNKCG